MLCTLHLALLARLQREKIKKKVAEAKRKSKRDSKKDVTWKNHSKFLHLAVVAKVSIECLLSAVFVHSQTRRRILVFPANSHSRIRSLLMLLS